MAVELLESLGRLPRQLERQRLGGHLPRKGRGLARPERREIAAALLLRLGAQRQQLRQRQREIRRGVRQRAELAPSGGFCLTGASIRTAPPTVSHSPSAGVWCRRAAGTNGRRSAPRRSGPTI